MLDHGMEMLKMLAMLVVAGLLTVAIHHSLLLLRRYRRIHMDKVMRKHGFVAYHARTSVLLDAIRRGYTTDEELDTIFQEQFSAVEDEIKRRGLDGEGGASSSIEA